MKIAVDARELAGHATGVGRYLGELLAEWAASPAALRHAWQLYAPEPIDVPEAFAASVRVLAGHGGTSWEQWHLPRALAADPPDLLFAPGYTAPLRVSCPVALTIHDVSFSAHPEWFRFREGARRRTLTRLSAARARVVLTDSNFSRQEIVRHLGVDPGRVRVIPLAVRAAATRGPAADRAPNVLFVGSIFTRRHVDTLVRAFAMHVLPSVPSSQLDIVGDNRSFPPIDLARVIAEQPSAARERISVRAYVDERTLAELYRRATLFAFPSEYEGFGLTPLEALAAGVVPVVLDIPVAREVYGPAARYVARSDALIGELGTAIADLLTGTEQRLALLGHAEQVLARYSWAHTAEQTLHALEGAARD